jgi:hypothetical protein
VHAGIDRFAEGTVNSLLRDESTGNAPK